MAQRRRIAVVGGGIAGMAAAYRLARHHRVTLIEAEPRLGGHARTVLAGKTGNQPVDMGFIVFNAPNYPELTSMFQELDVPVGLSEMSFSTSLDDGAFEYAFKKTNALRAAFAQPKNALDPRFLGMLRDIWHFNARALDAASDPAETLGDFLTRLGTGPWFRDRFLLPLTGAIWSTPTERMLDFPARPLVQFMENHALLGHTGHHQWFTVDGGSIQYVRRLDAALRARSVEIRLGVAAETLRPEATGVAIRMRGAWQSFDSVVLACHADQSARLLPQAPSPRLSALKRIRFQSHQVVLHSDARFMPRRRACWSAWNYLGSTTPSADRLGLTYWMNCLQPAIPRDDPLFVTLNPGEDLRDGSIHEAVTMHHPVYDLKALEARRRLADMNGQDRIWVCGAWMKNGFHEDGIASATEVAETVVMQGLP